MKRAAGISFGKFISIGIGIIPILLLSSCGASGALSIDVRVALYRGDKWQASADVLFSGQVIQIAGPQVTQQIDQLVYKWETQGADAHYEQKILEDENVRYEIRSRGTGYDLLNATIFDGQAVIEIDETASPVLVTFDYAPVGELFGAALSRTFTLQGGVILQSNGRVAEKNTVVWHNPVNTMHASLTPANQFDLKTLVYLGIGLPILVFLVLVIRRGGKRTCAYCSAKVPNAAEFCPECGAMLGAIYA